MQMPPGPLAYKIAVLIFAQNAAGDQLLILRRKQPNKGNWSPIGGKLEMGIGESPFECAARETREETGFEASPEDFHLFAMLAEKAYEGQAHWLIFLFQLRKPLNHLPPSIEEGDFGFFSKEQMRDLALPETDRKALWPIWEQHRDRFVALNIDCGPGQVLRIKTEQITG